MNFLRIFKNFLYFFYFFFYFFLFLYFYFFFDYPIFFIFFFLYFFYIFFILSNFFIKIIIIVYGSNNAGIDVENKSEEMNRKMMYIGKEFSKNFQFIDEKLRKKIKFKTAYCWCC